MVKKMSSSSIYVINLDYQGIPRNKAKNFSTQLTRVRKSEDSIKQIRRSKYVIDRIDVLKKVQKLADQYGVGIEITGEYSTIPPSLEKILNPPTSTDNLNKELLDVKRELMLTRAEFSISLKAVKIYTALLRRIGNISEKRSFKEIGVELGSLSDEDTNTIEEALKLLDNRGNF